MWLDLLPLLFLAVCAGYDVREKKIPLVVVWVGMALAVLLRVQGAYGEWSVLSVGLSVIPGLVFWLISLVTGEKVGYGDGWMLIMIGLYTDLWRCFLILLAGLFSESVAALVLLAARKISKDRQVPFAPFLLLGMGVIVFL